MAMKIYSEPSGVMLGQSEDFTHPPPMRAIKGYKSRKQRSGSVDTNG